MLSMGYEAANDPIDQLENVDALVLLQMTTKFTTQRIFFDNSGKYLFPSFQICKKLFNNMVQIQ